MEINMKTKYGFIKFDNVDEFRQWLNKKKVTRTIKLVQLHHTATRASVANKYDAFDLQENMKTYHVASCGWQDIAQQFTIFPDGSIMTGRDINTSPAGIKGANANGICIECYGYFDRGYDVMSAKQQAAVIAATKILLDRFNLTPSDKTITYHCWWTAGGTYIGDYKQGKSCKTCPGTNFFGGNTLAAFKKYLLPKIKEYGTTQSLGTAKQTNTAKTSTASSTVPYLIKVTADVLNIRAGAGINYRITGTIKKGEVYTIIQEKDGWGKLKSGAGWISLHYTKKK